MGNARGEAPRMWLFYIKNTKNTETGNEWDIGISDIYSYTTQNIDIIDSFFGTFRLSKQSFREILPFENLGSQKPSYNYLRSMMLCKL